MKYPIYHVLYDTVCNWDKEARVAADSEKRIPIIVEKYVKDIRIKSGRKPKDIGFKVLGFVDTGFKADKEGVIGHLSLDELIIKVKTRKK